MQYDSTAATAHDAFGGADASAVVAGYDDSLRITCDLVRRHVDEGREVRPSDHIQIDLGLDIVVVMEFVSDVESYFDVNISFEMLEGISTVEDVARAVLTLRNLHAEVET